MYDHFDQVFTYVHMVKSWKKARKGVMWKRNTQLYDINYSLHIQITLSKLCKGTWKSPGFHRFTIHERGKIRHIMSVRPEEKTIQKCLCDYCITPLLDRVFIYNNAATRKGKGYHFALRQLKKILHGKESAWALLFDFHNYFASIRHDVIKMKIGRFIHDWRIIRLLYHLIDCFGEIGLGLGSQISQNLALLMADEIDHVIAEVIRPEGYLRYMDDGIVVDGDRVKLKRCESEIRRIAERNRLVINEKKTSILPIRCGFGFLKKRFRLTNGIIIMKICRKSITHARQKLKKLAAQAEKAELPWQIVYDSMQSWRSYAKYGNAHYTIRNYEKLYTELVLGKYERSVLS